MLLEAGRRLVSCVRRENIVASFKGHEFAARLPEVSKGEDAAREAAKVLQALVRRFVVAGRQMLTDASIGISVFPRTRTTEEPCSPAPIRRCIWSRKAAAQATALFSQLHIPR